ncbi:uncharacterized protein I303_100589 [Kwoniella dejecticola CBS 10117]|uniref:Nudix hydrolase domain-containing protein n=1 Tax=Kwoniella dejecticola CBS 10117 TaxID=1296121 RepID=A0A1A6AFC8_9TREE|nr:uncharacterized protein I303_00592 [Kwoniella dejecticola CBS 10117]OBR88775.1 hypothetical protein I303_00592 [Kwoniella dejecticola CBS 10117]
MSAQSHPSADLQALLQDLRLSVPRVIQSPPTQPRRASVALIIRLKPAPELAFEGHEPEGYSGEIIKQSDFGLGYTLDDFFRLPWVNHPNTTPEILFIRRAPHQSSSSSSEASSSAGSSSLSRWSSHIAFPGGRHEPDDQSAYFTALRETWEEVGIDLAEKEFLHVGRLDEREVTTSLGKRLLMILSPFVFLQTSPFSPPPELQATEVSSVHWIPISMLAPPFDTAQWSQVEIDISSRLSPRNTFIRWCLRNLIGKMQFGCVLLPDEPDTLAEGFDPSLTFDESAEGSGSWFNDGKRHLRLWGLTLGMTLDLIAHYPSSTPAHLVLPPTSSKSSSPTTSEFSHNQNRNSIDFIPDPKTPVTVTSSFEDQWEAARLALEEAKKTKPQANGVEKTEVVSGAGLTATATSGLGIKVDVDAKKKGKNKRRRGVGPGMTAVFPRFSYPDVNFWIWVFGRRYRQVIQGWENSVRGPDRAADRRVNWSGQALATFYSAVRQALVVAIIMRALLSGVGIAGLTWIFVRGLGGFGGAGSEL